MPVFSSDLTMGPDQRRRVAGWGQIAGPLSQPDRDYLENKLREQQPNWITEDFARTQHLLNQDNAIKRGGQASDVLDRASAGRYGPATLALSRSGNPRPPAGPGGEGPGQVPDATAMNFALADPTIGYHKLALEDAVQQQQERASALFSPTASQRLHSGQAAADARATGDILRDEQLRNALATGTAEANTYLAPGQADKRRQQTWDDEYRARTMGPYDPRYVTGQANLQREIAKGQYAYLGDRAQAEARERGAVANAIRGLIASGALANSPEVQNMLIQQGIDIVSGAGNPGGPPNVMPPGAQGGQQPAPRPAPRGPVMPSSGPWGAMPPGGFNAPDPNIPQLRPFPRAQLAEYARQYGMSEPQAEEYLRRVQGFVVQ